MLSTFTLSEFLSGGVPVVRETIDNVTSTFVNPASPFVVNTPGGSNTVNILDTFAGIAISINGGGSDTVNVGNAGSVQGILGSLTIQNPPSFTTLNVNDSADTFPRTATLSTFTSGGANFGLIVGLAPAAISYKYADISGPVNITTAVGQVSWIVRADALASVTGVVVKDDGLQIN